MKILGVCGSPRPEKISTTHKVLSSILSETKIDYEIIHLADLKFSGCTACLGCAKDNICKLNDDLAPIRDKIIGADAFVIAAPNYFSGINSLTHAFLERWFQFRHQEGKFVWGKVAVAVGVGSMGGEAVIHDLDKFMLYNFVKTIDSLSVDGNPSCYYCGYGKTCEMGVPKMTGIECPSPSEIPDILSNQKLRNSLIATGRTLGNFLRNGYDRRLVSLEMQEALFDRLRESV